MSMTRTTYSAKLRAALDELRPEFQEVGKNLAQLTKRREELAPVFHKTYLLWKRETRRPFTAFVHELDPSMPVARKDYRHHSAYRAAEYLKTLATDPESMKGARGLTALKMLAVTIKSFLPLVGSRRDQLLALETLTKTTRWKERDINKLMAQVRRAKPISLPNTPRLVEAAKQTKAVVVAFERERVARAS